MNWTLGSLCGGVKMIPLRGHAGGKALMLARELVTSCKRVDCKKQNKTKKQNKKTGWARCLKSSVSAISRQRQADLYEFKVSLFYLGNSKLDRAVW